ncbi:MAG: major capsid protein V20 domain-containing protein, partial [Candidatus Fonsibacter sp.]
VGANLNGPRDGTNPSIQLVPTTGSILVLSFAEVIQLTEELYAPGSIGSSTFNCKSRSRTTRIKLGLAANMSLSSW